MSQRTSKVSPVSRPRRAREREKPRAEPPPSVTVQEEADLIVSRFRLRARIRGAWLQTLWSRDHPSANGSVVSPAELALLLADTDSPRAEQEWAAGQEVVRRWLVELRKIEGALARLTPDQSRMSRLAKIFGLDNTDRDLLEAAFAVAVDPALARVCGYLQDNAGRTYLTEDLVARLYGHGRCGVWSAEAPVFRWELVNRREGAIGEPAAVSCDPQIRDWMLNRPALGIPLVGLARIQAPPEPLGRWPVDEIARWLRQALERFPQPRLRVIVSGPAGSGRRSFAAVVAQRLQLPLLVIDADGVDDAGWPTLFLHAQRQAFLDTCALGWTGESLARRSWPSRSAPFPVQFCLAASGSEPPPANGFAERRLVLPSSTADDRLRLWREHLPAARAWPIKALRTLADQHPVNPGDILQAALSGATTPADAGQSARESARSRFDGLVQRLECPYRWNDLVVPEAVREGLASFVYEAQHRHRFWEEPANRRLFPQGRGLAALFSGTPGTGKTMAAQVIAADLGQDLFRVNLAHLTSKWVGETAKNVDHLLREAAELDAVVFFDEADAAFAKRSTEMHDAQDRFANTDAAHLLQAIEHYPGVVLLATNLKGNIDPAFFRRLRYVIEFPKPDAALQRELWTRLVSALAGPDMGKKLSPVLDCLSANIDVTGAQVKFAVLSAVFAAQAENKVLGARHLLAGLNRELSKEGRTIGPRETENILRSEHP